MNVLSLFDGMSCGRLALDKAGIPVTKYFASEIDRYAIAVSRSNYPTITQLGDVKDVTDSQFSDEIDLLIGGSPCQGFSFAGKNLNFEDPRSKLFFEYIRLKDTLKPKYFILENVKMKKESQDIISSYMGVEPVQINSSLFSAQNRVRLYWTNIPFSSTIEDKNLVLADIIEDGMVDRDKSYCIDANYFRGGSMKLYYEKSRRQLVFDNKGCHQVGEADIKGYDIVKRVYSSSGKSPSLTTMQGGHRQPKIVCGSIINRKINPETGKRDDYNPNIEAKPRIETRVDGKTGTLTTIMKDNVVVDHGKMYWRALTPKECERLQTVPDNYTKYGVFRDSKEYDSTLHEHLQRQNISNSQRYKMLGNGWTVDVISHIMKGMEV